MTTQIFGTVIQATLQGAGFGLAAKGFQSLGTAAGAAQAEMTKVSGTGRKLRGTLSGVGKFLAGPAGLALGFGSATTALVAFGRSAVNAADELGKAATRTGVTVESISSLEVAARQGGTSLATLETGLAGMSRRAADAAAGSASAGRGFAALGVEVRGANGEVRDSDDLYADVAHALAEMEDGAQKSAIAQQVFGRTGARLIPVLNQGAAALTNNVTTSNELARSSEALNDRMDDIRVIVSQAGRAVLTGLIPPMARLLTAVVNGAKELRQRFAPVWASMVKTFQEVSRVAKIVVTTVGKNLFGVLKSVGNFIGTLFGPAINAVQSAFRGLGKDTPVLGRALSSLAAFFVTVSGRAAELTQRIIGGATAALKFSQTIAAILRLDFSAARANYEGIGEAWATAAANADATRQRTDEAAAAIRNGVTPAAVEFTGEVSSAAATWGGVADNIAGAGGGPGGTGKSVKAAVEEVSEATRAAYEAEGVLEAERFARVQKNLENTTVIRFFENKRAADDLIANETRAFASRQSQVAEHEKVLKRQTDNHQAELMKVDSLWKGISQTVRSGLQAGIEGLIRGTTSWGQALNNIANNVLNSIISKFSKLATNSVFNVFTGGKSGGLGSLFGAGAAAAGKALAGGGAGAAAAGGAGAAAGLGKATAGIGKALGGVASALAPLAVVAAPFAIGSLFRKGESKETKRRRAEVTQLNERAIIESANQAITGRIRRPSGGSHPSRREREARREALDADPDRKIQLALSSSLFRNADKAAVEAILRKNIDKFQFGGIVPRTRGGRLALIGEGSRNEAVVPLPNGRAIPVEFQGPPRGGGTVNVTINIIQTESGAVVTERTGALDSAGLEQRLTDWALTNLQPGGIFAGVA